MLGRKQSLKGEPILADYGPEESLNESADIEWVNKTRERATNLSLLEKSPHSDSFSVRFATQSSTMETLRKHILQEGKQRAEEKMEEVRRAKSYCESLRTQINRLTHTYYTCWRTFRFKLHSERCELCRVEKERIIKNHLNFEEPSDTARFKALQCKESNAWLKSIPSPNIGKRGLYTISSGIKIAYVSGVDGEKSDWSFDKEEKPKKKLYVRIYSMIIND